MGWIVEEGRIPSSATCIHGTSPCLYLLMEVAKILSLHLTFQRIVSLLDLIQKLLYYWAYVLERAETAKEQSRFRSHDSQFHF